MVWLRYIEDLQYYKQPPGVECYCHNIFQPSELTLQGIFDSNASTSSPPAFQVYLFSADGLTDYGDITSYFQYYYGTNTQGKQYFAARLKSFAPDMCVYQCWILRVFINGHFDYFTERYCSPDCCQEATSVTINNEDFVRGNTTSSGDVVTEVTAQTQSFNTNPCGVTYMQFEIFSDCYNAFTRHMYRPVGTIFAGTSFNYKEILSINAVLRTTPTTITRDYSMNCRLQRVQKIDQWQLQGKELFPEAIAFELQNWFTNQYIFIDGTRYELATSEIFETVVFPHNCTPMYRLNMTLQGCNVKQIFGCGDKCADNSKAFVFGGNVDGDGYWTENKNYVGSTCEDLQTYFLSQTGITSATILDPDDYGCEFECGILVEALPDAYLPTSVYKGGVFPANRVFGISAESLADICTVVTPLCDTPVIGDVTNAASVCDTPVIGDITNEDIPAESVYITGTTEWIAQDIGTNTVASRAQGTVTASLKVFNSSITYDSSDPDATIPEVSVQIGYISQSAWPQFDKQIVSNPVLDALGAVMMIQANGAIIYAGQVTSADLTGSTIDIPNFIYTLP